MRINLRSALVLRMLLIWMLLAWLVRADAQTDYSKVEIKATELAPGVHALFGAGGNMGLLVGADGAVLIDDQYAPLTPKIRAAIALLSERPPRFVINTHWHSDHTGGNESFGQTGSIIVAHDNTRKRMSTDQFVDFFNAKEPAAPAVALPVITFASDLRLHLNGQQIDAVHVRNAHTDTDVLLFIAPANVIHAGDIFFHPMYPFIDMGSGGSVDGVLAACTLMLARSDAQTKIIPGHGPIATRQELEAWCGMLSATRERVVQAIRAGQTLEQTLAARPSAEFDARYGAGFIKPDVWVQRLYTDLRRNHAPRKGAR